MGQGGEVTVPQSLNQTMHPLKKRIKNRSSRNHQLGLSLKASCGSPMCQILVFLCIFCVLLTGCGGGEGGWSKRRGRGTFEDVKLRASCVF
jgi:hypothetical protein